MISGGLALAFAGALAAGFRSEEAAYGAFAVGSAVGGFTAGRCSAHRSLFEPAIAGALVVLVVLAFARATAVGELAIDMFRDTVTDMSLRLGGIGFAGGLLGALVGEFVTRGPPPAGALRWVWTSVLVTTGALVVALTAAGAVLVDEAAEAAIAQFFQGDLGRAPLIEEARLVMAGGLAAATAAFAGGMVTQMAAPRRLLLPAASGAVVVVAGLVLAPAAVYGEPFELAGPAALAGATAGALAWFGALLGRVIG